ncbi:MAG: ABC transporter permease [Chloroherpetonaceae bacterium]|nr:ABC transporter permease [Chloroherpetonaceae bacterium]MCS7211139.1 ABC transporter permease [Chloroherpetonaceae bacterium]MDW8018477.1 ABC transporter permease [Chloroherpetonaceae bacterium]MDW8466385.1 ABC transporter permease [Chloroherpetonaceae bacterium]
MKVLPLIEIEFLKTTRRAAFWITAGIYTLFAILILSFLVFVPQAITFNNREVFLRLPEGWSGMIGLFKWFSTIYVPVTITLLAASEFTYRTARQNVIDGLSKEAFFLSKLWLIVFTALLYVLIFFVSVLVFGAIGSAKQGISEPLIRWQDVDLIAAYFVVLLGYGTIAFLFSFLTRSAGAALASTLLYTIIIENIASVVFSFFDSLKTIVKYLPTRVFDDLLNPLRYDAQRLEQTTAQVQKLRDEVDLIVRDMPSRAEQARQALEQMEQLLPAYDNFTAFVLGFSYMLALLTFTYLVFEQQDL